MSLGSVEVGGAIVGCTTGFHYLISKIKCFYKRPWCLCACIDQKEHDLLRSENDKSESGESGSSKSD